MSLADVEVKTKEYSDAYTKLKDKLSSMEDEVGVIKKKYMPAIKKLATDVNEKHSVLSAEIERNPGAFEKPRTVVFHGIKVGMQKGKGKIDFDDKQTVKLIKKHFPERVDILIVVEEKPVKKALNQLTIADLKKIGVHVVEAQDEPVIKSTDSDIQKMVDALIAEETKRQDKEETEAA